MTNGGNLFSLLKLQYFFLYELKMSKRDFYDLIPYEADILASMWVVNKKKKLDMKNHNKRAGIQI